MKRPRITLTAKHTHDSDTFVGEIPLVSDDERAAERSFGTPLGAERPAKRPPGVPSERRSGSGVTRPRLGGRARAAFYGDPAMVRWAIREHTERAELEIRLTAIGIELESVQRAAVATASRFGWVGAAALDIALQYGPEAAREWLDAREKTRGD